MHGSTINQMSTRPLMTTDLTGSGKLNQVPGIYDKIRGCIMREAKPSALPQITITPNLQVPGISDKIRGCIMREAKPSALPQITNTPNYN